jgi:hypothetical protein
MATGQVLISQDNTLSGGITAVERKVLFIGEGGASAQFDLVHSINAQTDLDAILGTEDSALKTNIEATMLNAGPNFTGYVIPTKATGGAYTWDTALEFALDAPNDIDVELVVLTDEMASANDVDLYHGACVAAQNVYAKYITIHAAVAGNDGSQTWAAYASATKALQTDKAAHRVYLVPQLHGNNLGVVVGRLINDAFSLGDSPMRVLSGAVVGLGAAPVDSAGLSLTMAHLKDLADNRFSVPQTYTGLEGTYWADHSSLDVAIGDFKVYENLRVLDYITRRVRLKAISKIADKSLNSSPSSISYHENFFMQPIFTAAKSFTINDEPKPGLVKTPQKGDIVISWVNTTEVEIYMKAAPGDSPKKIGVHISLDLNRLA